MIHLLFALPAWRPRKIASRVRSLRSPLRALDPSARDREEREGEEEVEICLVNER